MLISSAIPSVRVHSYEGPLIAKTLRAILDATVSIKAQIDGFTKGVKIGDHDVTAVMVSPIP